LVNITVEKGFVASLIRAQRDCWVDARRAPGWHVARDRRNEREEDRNARERHRVVHADAEQETLQQSCTGERSDEP